MGVEYNIPFAIVSSTAAKTLIYVTALATMCLEIIDAHIGADADETNEQLFAGWARVTTLGTPTGTDIASPDIRFPTNVLYPAATFTGKYDITASEPTVATASHGVQAFTSLGGYHWEPVEKRLIIPPSASAAFKILSASFTAKTFRGEIGVRVIG